MAELLRGFRPVFDGECRVLILGSFPSVKSRQMEFYYGNPRNRFWNTVCGFFGESVPETVSGKRAFLLRRNIALWDIVTECEIVGSQDATIKNFKAADLCNLLQNSKIEFIMLNGGKAYEVFLKYYGGISLPYIKLPSTSPANTRFNEEEWHDALRRALG